MRVTHLNFQFHRTYRDRKRNTLTLALPMSFDCNGCNRQFTIKQMNSQLYFTSQDKLHGPTEQETKSKNNKTR